MRLPFEFLSRMVKSMMSCTVLLSLLAVAAFSGIVFAGITGDEAFQRLMDGNQRYVSGAPAQKDLGEARRRELSKGQHPFAIVITCSDSRVPPEILFDQALGDVFVIRVAGNVVDPLELGSIEYAAEQLHSPLLFILGHSDCGAVKATLEAKGKPEGNIGKIIGKIAPAAKAARKKGGTEEEILETAIKENVRNVYKDILKRSKIVRHFVREGKLKIAGGEYDIASGRVEMIGLP